MFRTFATTRSLIILFFFASGVPALVYQLAWQRVLFRMFGVNMESVTIVVTAFMLGLGVGSLIGSWLALRRAVAPLLLIAAIELSIGGFGAVSLQLFAAADPLVRDMPLAGQIAAALALLFVPTALMGMTLPLLAGYLISRSANVGLSTGSLYRVNTLGAVIGCLGAGFLLFPFLGLQRSVWSVAALNGAIGIAAFSAFLLARGKDAPEPDAARIADNAIADDCGAAMPIGYGTGLALAFLAGFVSLSYEIFLMRLASFESATSAIELTLTLAAFLLGIASGAQVASEWCAGYVSGAELSRKLLASLLASAILGLLLLPLLSVSAPLGGGMIAIILVAAFAIARALGAIFPLITHLTVRTGPRSGGRVGLVLVSDILGSAAGSLVTGFVLTDLFGARALAVLLALLTFAVGAPFLRIAGGGTKWLLPGAVAALVLMFFQAPLSVKAMDSMLYKRLLPVSAPLSRVMENRDGIIAVGSDGTVYGGGIYDGHFNTDPMHDVNGIIRAYGLSLYHPHPRDVLMIGLASGSWGQVIAANPDVERFIIVEINPGYLPLIREQPQVASLLTNPKVHIVIDDGRRWLRRHPEARFDAVMANTSYHFRANASNVLSLEFGDLIRAHLRPGGIFFYNATGSLRVQRTACLGFRYGYRVTNHMLVSDSPFDLDVARWRSNLLRTRIDGRPVFDLRRARDAAALREMLSLPAAAPPGSQYHRMEPCSAILARTTGLPPVTDDNMGTEWRYPLGLE